MRAPLWLSHCGEMGVVRDGCLKRVVPSHCVYLTGMHLTGVHLIGVHHRRASYRYASLVGTCFLHYYARATVAKSLRRNGCCARWVFEKGGPESLRGTRRSA